MAANGTLDVLKTRITAKEITGPAPDADAIRQALEAAVAAPDHGRMRPWRFILIEGDARAAFGKVLADALKRRKPEANPGELEHEAKKPLRSPLMIVVAAKLAARPGVPEIEQILATGAAVQNLALALHAQGFASAWKTGEPAYDPNVKAALGLEANDAIVGFLYVGTPSPVPGLPPRPKPQPDEYVRHWSGPPG
jgi:nitroreductase